MLSDSYGRNLVPAEAPGPRQTISTHRIVIDGDAIGRPAGRYEPCPTARGRGLTEHPARRPSRPGRFHDALTRPRPPANVVGAARQEAAAREEAVPHPLGGSDPQKWGTGSSPSNEGRRIRSR